MVIKLLTPGRKSPRTTRCRCSGALAIDLEQTLAKLTKLLDELQASSEEALVMLQNTAYVESC